MPMMAMPGPVNASGDGSATMLPMMFCIPAPMMATQPQVGANGPTGAKNEVS